MFLEQNKFGVVSSEIAYLEGQLLKIYKKYNFPKVSRVVLPTHWPSLFQRQKSASPQRRDFFPVYQRKIENRLYQGVIPPITP